MKSIMWRRSAEIGGGRFAEEMFVFRFGKLEEVVELIYPFMIPPHLFTLSAQFAKERRRNDNETNGLIRQFYRDR